MHQFDFLKRKLTGSLRCWTKKRDLDELDLPAHLQQELTASAPSALFSALTLKKKEFFPVMSFIGSLHNEGRMGVPVCTICQK